MSSEAAPLCLSSVQQICALFFFFFFLSVWALLLIPESVASKTRSVEKSARH